MSVQEMGTAITAASRFQLIRPCQSLAAEAETNELKPEIFCRVLTQSEGEYLAQTFGSIRTGMFFISTDEFRQGLRNDTSTSAFQDAVNRYRNELLEQRLNSCTTILTTMLETYGLSIGGRETLAMVVAAFHEGIQQSHTTERQSPVELNAQNPAVFGVFADLHHRSVLHLDGASGKVTFPYPEGFEAFELAVKKVAPLVASAHEEK